MGIRENIENIEREIDRICAAKEMDRAGILLVAVTKTVGVDKIREAVECGISVLGENKVQEITDKFDKIDENVQWHMIGHLQKNKVKHITLPLRKNQHFISDDQTIILILLYNAAVFHNMQILFFTQTSKQSEDLVDEKDKDD